MSDPLADDLSARAVRELVDRYRRTVNAMSGEDSAEVALALARALAAVERARTRETLSDDLVAAEAVRVVRDRLAAFADPL
jgi:hypothetical protein